MDVEIRSLHFLDDINNNDLQVFLHLGLLSQRSRFRIAENQFKGESCMCMLLSTCESVFT